MYSYTASEHVEIGGCLDNLNVWIRIYMYEYQNRYSVAWLGDWSLLLLVNTHGILNVNKYVISKHVK